MVSNTLGQDVQSEATANFQMRTLRKHSLGILEKSESRNQSDNSKHRDIANKLGHKRKWRSYNVPTNTLVSHVASTLPCITVTLPWESMPPAPQKDWAWWDSAILARGNASYVLCWLGADTLIEPLSLLPLPQSGGEAALTPSKICPAAAFSNQCGVCLYGG